ncbi:tRNA-dihydrouridine synthase [Verticillium alfalfae VaMs.102]|uniref:tRNA-dihydrouridine synthase n=1 Tax=Verticillium alfalfae (strain VaMs.102 / ATCC MYA-4576 / FGSC 10136) TaxID=526221 RepID=C9SVF6_VERA1|nr:tRNA-dihydrouridine synthase [Verticillium alfalfae VaMs.102]EEY22771.1 tRNA-dihydrouridine synthase [Verticillium alfalfae VaMs.102]
MPLRLPKRQRPGSTATRRSTVPSSSSSAPTIPKPSSVPPSAPLPTATPSTSTLAAPQGIARKGHYGAFLQEDQDLVFRLVNTLHRNLSIPVTAKIRILDTREATLAYALNVLRAGASILTVHGRRREQKGHLTGLADWSTIRWLRDQLPPETVLFANGNILEHGDLAKCLEATGADAVMSAEGNLSDPGLFAAPPADGDDAGRAYWRGRDGKGGWRVDEPEDEDAEQPARKKVKRDGGGGGGGKKKDKVTSPNYGGMQPHMFHLLRHFVSRHTDVRDMLAKARSGDLEAYEAILAAVERKVAEGLLEYERTDGKMFAEADTVLAA